MTRYIDTSGRTNLGVGICDRCSRKFPLEELKSDPNSPELMVCLEDRDEYDPYRLPARETEDVNLPFVRPDRDLEDTDKPFLYSYTRVTGEGLYRETEGGELRVIESYSEDVPWE